MARREAPRWPGWTRSPKIAERTQLLGLVGSELDDASRAHRQRALERVEPSSHAVGHLEIRPDQVALLAGIARQIVELLPPQWNESLYQLPVVEAQRAALDRLHRAEAGLCEDRTRLVGLRRAIYEGHQAGSLERELGRHAEQLQ